MELCVELHRWLGLGHSPAGSRLSLLRGNALPGWLCAPDSLFLEQNHPILALYSQNDHCKTCQSLSA